MLTFCRPVNNPKPTITTNYGPNHKAKDYAETIGTPVYAKQDGTIRIVQQNEQRQWIANSPSDPFPHIPLRTLTTADYGNCIVINHAEGFQSLDAHLKYGSICVKDGETVKKGQKIAEVGSTGNSTGNHLHDELRLMGNNVNLSFYFDPDFTSYFVGGTIPVSEIDQLKNKIRTVLNGPLGDGEKVIEVKKIIA